MSFNPRKIVAADTETNGIRYWHEDEPFAVSMCDEDGHTYYTSWYVDPFTREVFPDPKDIKYLKGILENPEIVKHFFNLKFDMRMLEKVGINVCPPFHDGLIASRVCNTTERQYGLKYLSKRYAGIPDDDEKLLQLAVTAARRKAKSLGWNLSTYGDSPSKADYWFINQLDRSNDICEKYARADALRTMVLGVMYQDIMDNDPVLKGTYEREMQLFPEIMAMELRGVALDVEANTRELERAKRDKQEHYQAMLEFLEEEGIQWWAGENRVDFNPNSSPQMYRVLFNPNNLGLKSYKNTDSGKPSLAWEDLKPNVTVPFVRHLLLYRRAEKELSSFFGRFNILKTEDHLNPGGYCIHPTFNQNQARTLRLSSSNPNAQNIGSKKTAARSFEAIEARVVFVPRPNYHLLKLDYSQQELRLFAELSGEKLMLETLANGGDLNTENANRLWGGDTPYSHQAIALALEMGSENPSDIAREAWKTLKWTPEKARKLGAFHPNTLSIARLFLRDFDFDIVEAEGALGKKNSRTRAKCSGYAIIYGGTWKALMAMLYADEAEARAVIQRYYEVFPQSNPKNRDGFVYKTIKQARKDGFITTLYGDRLNVERDFAFRSINYLIQGTAAGQLKSAMRRIGPYLRRIGLDCHIVLSIHDELDLECRKDHTYKWLLRHVKKMMEDTEGKIKTPMVVEVERCLGSWDKSVPVKL